MLQALKRQAPWAVIWLVLTALGATLLARQELSQLREAFDTDARIVHRLLSQRVVQHDAIMATLALLQPATGADLAAQPAPRLSSVYPQILEVARRDGEAVWPDEKLAAAEAESLRTRHAALAGLDLAAGRYWLVLAAQPTSYALLIDLRSTIPWTEWPMQAKTSPVRVALAHAGQQFVVQPGLGGAGDWTFDFHKHLASESQPFDVVATRQVGWAELPWPLMLGWAVLVAAVLAVLRALQSQRASRRRAEELLRLGQVARLNTLGELAAGMAHELNQPLTAMLANTQAANRLLAEEPPELDTARAAMTQAAAQARRASEVVGRLRRAVERPDPATQTSAVLLQDAVNGALYLLEPEMRRRDVNPHVMLQQASPRVQVEPVALEQVIHNLLMNALQALDRVPAPERKLVLSLSTETTQGVLTVRDSGPGFAAGVLPRIFEPFFSTREGGLGLGLSLCETLASGMGGSLSAAHNSPRGAVFRLALPLADSGKKKS